MATFLSPAPSDNSKAEVNDFTSRGLSGQEWRGERCVAEAVMMFLTVMWL